MFHVASRRAQVGDSLVTSIANISLAMPNGAQSTIRLYQRQSADMRNFAVGFLYLVRNI
jgi:hypothetical protein